MTIDDKKTIIRTESCGIIVDEFVQINLRMEEYNQLKSELEELKWYRSQALIRREDAVRVINNLAYMGRPFVEDIEQIPKAEPPSEIKRELNERNGDCSTCKHYDEPCCKKCGDGLDYYEPYIPNPIEDCKTCDYFGEPVCDYCCQNNPKYIRDYYKPYIPKE